MEENSLIKYEGGLVQRVGDAISVTNKLLALAEPHLIPYRKKDKWGFCTPDKKIVIDCKYDKTFPFSDGLAQFILNEKFGYINKHGDVIIESKYDWANVFKNGHALIKRNEKFGIINDKNENVLEPIYEYIDPFNKDEEHFIVRLNGKMGIISQKGIHVTELIYDKLDHFVDGIASFKINNKVGIIDRDGIEIIPGIYNSASILSKKFILVETDNNNFFYINMHNERVSTKNKEFASIFSEGLAIFPDYTNMKYGFTDAITWEIIVPFIYEKVSSFIDGWAKVKLEGKHGFIDRNGNQTIACKYQELGDFKNGLAYFKLNDKYGYIDKKEQVRIDPIYDNACDFKNGIAKVCAENLEGYINEEGMQYWED